MLYSFKTPLDLDVLVRFTLRQILISLSVLSDWLRVVLLEAVAPGELVPRHPLVHNQLSFLSGDTFERARK